MSENKGDLISREAALQELSGLCESWEDEDSTSYQALDIVGNLPAVDAQPVVHGRWVEGEKNRYWGKKGNYICSNCHSSTGFVKFNYCPNCGAKMDGGDTDE